MLGDLWFNSATSDIMTCVNIKGGQLLISNKSGTISAQITSEGKLIAKEGEFSGKIVSTSGEIGGFNIDNYSLWSGQNALGGSGVYISPKYGISCNSSFQVTAGGKLTASDVDISGDVVAQNMFAKDSYKIYASGLGKSIKAIWCGDNWEPDDGYVDLYIGNDSKSWAAFIDKTPSDYKFTRRAIMASQYFNTSNRQNNYSSVNCVTDQDTTYVELTTISKDTPASVRLQIAADSGLCLIPGDVNDSTLTYDESIKLGTKSHKWMQVWTKNLYANGDTVRFSGIPAKSSNRYLVIDSSGNVGYRDGSGGGSELSQEYAAGTGIKIVNSKISLTGTIKDNNRYVKNPIDGTLHMSNGCGWDLVNRDRTLKDRIIYFDNNESFDKFFMDLKPVSYHLKYEDESEDHYGFIAQDVEKSFNLANIDCDNLGIIRKNKLDKPNQAGLCMEYSLAYEEFIPINIMMTQKAHRRIDELENEIKKLKQIINSLQGVA